MAAIKTNEDIQHLREAGKLHARILRELKNMVRPGMQTRELDAYARRAIMEAGDTPAFLGYRPEGAPYPYPAALCVSVNNEIVHGIPGDRVLREGDIVGLDLGVTHHGRVTDAAITVPVGEVDESIRRLLHVTRRALEAGIAAARAGVHIGDISAAIGEVGARAGYGIVRELGGHGVGHRVHEEPYIPNYGRRGTGPVLRPGMVLALEPMFTIGGARITFADDGYTILTRDGSYAAHFEHTILITEGEAEILTTEEGDVSHTKTYAGR